MKINFGPKGIIQIDDASIIFRNFSGAASKFNREGDRNFAVVIDDQEIADALVQEGWNVRIKPARKDGDDPFMYLPVKIKFNYRGPNVYLQSGPSRTKLDEESIRCLDDIDIASADIDIRPYDWDVNGKTGRTAYLEAICVTQKVDRFAPTRFETVAESDDDSLPF